MKTEINKINYLEGLAVGIWKTKLWVTEKHFHGHCKHYDPLTINKIEKGYECLSYVFDFHDGGRRHYFKSLSDVENALHEEIKK